MHLKIPDKNLIYDAVICVDQLEHVNAIIDVQKKYYDISCDC